MERGARDRAVRRLWDESAPGYAALALELPSYLRSNRRLVEASDLRAGHAVLDLACGGGATLDAALAVEPDLGRCWALDWSAPMVEEARRRLEPRLGERLETRVASAHEIDRHLEAGAVDRALCNGAFFQFDRPLEVFEQLARALGAGGLFAFTLPVPSNALHFLELFHRHGVSRPLQATQLGRSTAGRPGLGPPKGGGPGSGRCTVSSVDDLLAEAGWRRVGQEDLRFETSHEDYVRWMTLPVFRRPEWMERDGDELRAELLAALRDTDVQPIVAWRIVVAAPP